MFAMQEQRLVLMKSCDQPIVVKQWGGWLGYPCPAVALRAACQPNDCLKRHSG